MTLLTRLGQRYELKPLKNAMANANFVAEHCFHGQEGNASFVGHDLEAPFAMLLTHEQSATEQRRGFQINGRNRLYQNALNPNELLNVDLIR